MTLSAKGSLTAFSSRDIVLSCMSKKTKEALPVITPSQALVTYKNLPHNIQSKLLYLRHAMFELFHQADI